jgi:hypothetical protein
MALCFVLALLLAAPPLVLAGETGVLTGRVLPPPDSRVTAKAVWVGAVPAPVAADGSFRVDGIRGGTTELAIETSDGLYVVATPVTIAPGTTRSVQLAFGGRQDTSPPPPSDNAKNRAAFGEPVTATPIVVGPAIVGFAVDQLTEFGLDPVSPTAPIN